MEAGFKRGFDEADQVRLAESSQQKKSFRRGGLGWSEDGDGGQQQSGGGGHGGGGAAGAGGGAGGGGGGGNIQHQAASHYNNRADTHRRLDSKSPTLQQKNLNNWIKSLLIQSVVRPNYSILDLACGKGGDLPKWARQEIGHYVGIDIAYKSVQDAIERYNGTPQRPANCKFPAVWCSGNFVNPRLFDRLEHTKAAGVRFDAVSCQFAIHYSWTSERDAKAALWNAARRLKPGGLFCGTTTDGNVLVKKLQASPGLSFGNSLYRVEFLPPEGQDPEHFDKTFRGRSPFGLKYRFYLQDAVDDCVECLVHFPTFKRIGAECGLKLVEETNFVPYVERALMTSSKKDANFELLKRMRVLEHFREGGTMSQDQWEVAHLYKVFVFQRQKEPPQEGRPNWNDHPVQHRHVDPKELCVLTDDCAPGAL